MRALILIVVFLSACTASTIEVFDAPVDGTTETGECYRCGTPSWPASPGVCDRFMAACVDVESNSYPVFCPYGADPGPHSFPTMIGTVTITCRCDPRECPGV